MGTCEPTTTLAVPPTTIRSSGSSAIACARSSRPAKSVVTTPSVPKEESRWPESVKRATRKSTCDPCRTAPATTMRPSDWSATALACPEPPTTTRANPPTPNVTSSAPSGQYLVTISPVEFKAPAVDPRSPATTIFPSG